MEADDPAAAIDRLVHHSPIRGPNLPGYRMEQAEPAKGEPGGAPKGARLGSTATDSMWGAGQGLSGPAESH